MQLARNVLWRDRKIHELHKYRPAFRLFAHPREKYALGEVCVQTFANYIVKVRVSWKVFGIYAR